jgi:hypothetical protein
MTLLIKVVGGRELVMVYLAARDTHSRAIGDRYPTGSTSSRFDRSAAQSTKDAIVDRPRLYRIAHAGIIRVSPKFLDWALPPCGIDGTGREVNAIGHFQDVRVPVRC